MYLQHQHQHQNKLAMRFMQQMLNYKCINKHDILVIPFVIFFYSADPFRDIFTVLGLTYKLVQCLHITGGGHTSRHHATKANRGEITRMQQTWATHHEGELWAGHPVPRSGQHTSRNQQPWSKCCEGGGSNANRDKTTRTQQACTIYGEGGQWWDNSYPAVMGNTLGDRT